MSEVAECSIDAKTQRDLADRFAWLGFAVRFGSGDALTVQRSDMTCWDFRESSAFGFLAGYQAGRESMERRS